MLMFLLEYQDQECVLEVFVWLETVLEQEAFKKLFPVILTDGGSEFSARKEMEEFCDGSKSTTIFYCDPYCFWQKGACEKNHEYIRYIRPKGSSFADLDDEKIMLMMNHINSEKRDSLNGHSPYELSLLLLSLIHIYHSSSSSFCTLLLYILEDIINANKHKISTCTNIIIPVAIEPISLW